jgi:3-phosphoshikimate 1-carboxyvinyltransferase
MVDIVRELGADVSFDHRERTMRIANHQERLHGDYKFNVSDCPNIVPTLAVLGAFVEGRFRVEGASITRFHKSSRVVAMATELSKLGAKIRTLKDNDVVAGFEIEGRCSYPGGVHLSSWGDHRVFMSLFIACLKAEGPCELDGFNDTDCSFPGFIERFVDSGVQVDRVTP